MLSPGPCPPDTTISPSTCTNIPGVFAIGDVRTKALRQIVTAASDGATCSYYIEQYLLDKE